MHGNDKSVCSSSSVVSVGPADARWEYLEESGTPQTLVLCAVHFRGQRLVPPAAVEALQPRLFILHKGRSLRLYVQRDVQCGDAVRERAAGDKLHACLGNHPAGN